uniref:Uncharacterized protein n=1 Tax=Parascaris univalens TaxID=6257 RepID=A0A915CFK0_PARUN
LPSARVLLTRITRQFFALSNCRRCVQYDCFADRHIGPSDLEKRQMLDYLGFKVSTLFSVCYVYGWTRGGGEGGKFQFHRQ